MPASRLDKTSKPIRADESSKARLLRVNDVLPARYPPVPEATEREVIPIRARIEIKLEIEANKVVPRDDWHGDRKKRRVDGEINTVAGKQTGVGREWLRQQSHGQQSKNSFDLTTPPEESSANS